MAELKSSIYNGSADDFEHSCGQCILDGHEVEAHGFCTDCPGYLCVTCFRAHKINRASRHHKLLGNDELSSAGIAQVSTSICTEKCSVHINEIVKFFCSMHESLCCNDCVILNHRNCEVDYIPEKCLAMEDFTEFQETLQELDKCQKTSDSVKIAAEKTDGEIDSSTETAINQIRTFEEELHENIEKLREKVENELEIRRTTNKEIVKDVVDTCDKLSSSLNQFRKGMLDSKEKRNLAQLYITIKNARIALKSVKMNKSVKRLCETRTHLHFQRSSNIETLLDKTSTPLCLGMLKDTGPRDAIIMKRKKQRSCLYVTALYVGSSHMSFGFSTMADPKSVKTSTWHGGILVSHKAPTSLLIKPDEQSVCAVGYEADQKYNELVEDGEEKTYFYYHGDYVLNMYKDMDKRRTFVYDVSGKKLPSTVVLSTLIGCLKDKAVSWIAENVRSYQEGDVHFVITVPERFKMAKEVMEEAAVQAGIDSKRYTIVFETEAAFMYTQDSDNYCSTEYPESPVKQIRKGVRYLVLDARAKLFTTTVYEICKDKSTQLHHEAVESCGGDSVKEEIEKFMSNAFGHDLMQTFRSTHPEDYRELVFSIHEKLSSIRTQKNRTAIRNVLATRLFDFIQEQTGGTASDILCKQSTGGKITVSNRGLEISSSNWVQFLQPSLSTMSSHIHSVLQDKAGLGCAAIVMIGGFSNSFTLQDGLRMEFPDLKIIIPKLPETAVLSGACALGHLE